MNRRTFLRAAILVSVIPASAGVPVLSATPGNNRFPEIASFFIPATRNRDDPLGTYHYSGADCWVGGKKYGVLFKTASVEFNGPAAAKHAEYALKEMLLGNGLV